MTDVTEPAKRTRMGPEERRRQILRVASRLFSERPYSEVSVNDIAEGAGIARGLMHHYFGSKRELYLEVVRRSTRVPPVEVPDGDGGPDVWELAVDGFLAAIEKHPDVWLNAATVGAAERDDEVAAILDEAREIYADQTLAAIGLAHRGHEPVVRAFVRAWGGFVQELTIEWIGRGRIDADRVRTTMLATLPLLVHHVLPLLDQDRAARDATRSGSAVAGDAEALPEID